MNTVTINILDSNGNVIDTKEIDESSLAVYQQYYNVQTLDSQPTTVQTITTEAQNILNKLESGEYQFPTWFNTNIEWLKTGKISSQDFINAYNHLDNDGLIIDLTQTPQTFNVTVYELDNNAQITSENYPNATVEFQQNLISQNKLIYIGSHNQPSLEFVRQHYNYVETYVPPVTPTIPEPEPDNSSFTFPMVSQLGVEFELKNNRVTGRVVLNKISSNWNPYYNDMNLISYFELRNKNGITISSLGQVKQNIVKFPPSQPPLLPSQELTFDESAVDYKELQVRIYLWTENNIAVAEPLIFTVKEDSVPIDVVNPSDNRVKRDDFMSKAVGIFGGLLGVSLLISGNQKV